MGEYQAIYDAVRSRISNTDVGSVLTEVLRNSFGHAGFLLEQSAQENINAAQELQRPSVVFKPLLSKDGNEWCALLGENLQEGLAAFGSSPAEAMANFDKAWYVKEANQ